MKNNQIIHLNPYNSAAYDQEIRALYRQLSSDLTAQKRLREISGFFLGRPYLRGALGEGPEGYFDQSPLYRTDSFDCLTYVSTVLALFFAENLADFQRNMLAVNYRQSRAAYENRYHFMNVDWNAANIKSGWLEDITLQIIGRRDEPLALKSKTFIDRPNWFRYRQANDIKLLNPLSIDEANYRLAKMRGLADQLRGENSELAYVPLTELFDKNQQPNLQIFSQIPEGSIIEIVRPQWDLRQQIGTYLDISHLGFGMYSGKTLMFREASLLEEKIIDISLSDYLRHYINHATIKGIQILALRQ